MKKTILIIVISLGIFVLAGCGNTAEKANTDAPKNANTDANQNKEPAKTVFKPVEISPDAVKVNELVDKVLPNLNTWKGKEVSVTGYVTSTSVGENRYALGLKNDEMGNSEKTVGCQIKNEDLPEEIMGKAVEVKGTVSFKSENGKWKSVTLDPCTLKK